MKEENNNSFHAIVVIILIVIALIAWLGYSSYQRNLNRDRQIEQCKAGRQKYGNSVDYCYNLDDKTRDSLYPQ